MNGLMSRHGERDWEVPTGPALSELLDPSSVGREDGHLQEVKGM